MAAVAAGEAILAAVELVFAADGRQEIVEAAVAAGEQTEDAAEAWIVKSVAWQIVVGT